MYSNNVTAVWAQFLHKHTDIMHHFYCFTKVIIIIIVVVSSLSMRQKCRVVGERRTQGLLGMRGCGPPGGAPLGEKRSGLLMRE